MTNLWAAAKKSLYAKDAKVRKGDLGIVLQSSFMQAAGVDRTTHHSLRALWSLWPIFFFAPFAFRMLRDV
jgi:hypothetical protein